MRFAFAIPFAGLALASSIPDVSSTLQNILKNTEQTNKYKYPTDFTRGILPKPFHSHNDYWRDVPFYSGLSYGAVSTEADVWLINGTLYVGHERQALTKERTLESLYINPILDTLHRQNPVTDFSNEATFNGVFDMSSAQTLYFFIDLKTSGPETWPAVLSALEPLRNAEYLSTYDGTTFTSKPVTVIGTGNTPIWLVQSAVPRDAFYDAPLAQLGGEFSNITANDSPIASTDFEASFGQVRTESFNDTQLETLRKQLKTAHDKGIKARYWNQPGFPIGTRNAVWRTLYNEGADFVNVDDLEGAAGFWESHG
ncbi:uncharacterized protein N0V89_010766 [Didymosphaeria variabile]|uniref:Altered inheritance of mitochondria protein 6 n=1 Tax=Didymosphaeria variabile TaxID=1932322 RepID=A0A9W9C6H8_9PLEO|nr:uncharacterized protein N0V89_010766 [Didymosphaeria variabile]KAJ4346834.1 hypothetical protein N0V89_010766 [Didymosphaeria variabile]